MKQHKTVNINVKIRLNRKPFKKEKIRLVKFIAEQLDNGYPALYSENFSDFNTTSLVVKHHHVTIRKMG